MTEPITARDLANELADTHSIDRASALFSLGTYLANLIPVGDIDIDSDVSAEHADAVRAAFKAADLPTQATVLDDLAETRDKIEALTQLQIERTRLVRKAIDTGARVVDITAASGLTRARIYQIRDGR